MASFKINDLEIFWEKKKGQKIACELRNKKTVVDSTKNVVKCEKLDKLSDFAEIE